MPIKPKHNIDSGENISYSGRQFTNREEYTKAFRNKIESASRSEYGILSFYGVGGIGKSTLRKELGRILTDAYPEILWSYTDFELQAFREAETSLYHLRKNLKEKYKVEFPMFDIAYTIYWQKSHPQVTITKDTLPFLEDGTIVSDLLSHVGGIPVVGLLPSIAKAVYKSRNIFKTWWIKRGQRELYDLPSLSPKEILERLPMYFSLDLKDYLKEHSKKAVIFMDSYEALWENFSLEGGFFLRDEWVRELVSHLPGVVWVICGREKLRWNEMDNDWETFTEQHLLGGLSETDSAYFLRSCGITNPNIQKVIISASKGVPYYLDLAVDTYQLIKQKYNREPEETDFARNQQEVLTRFLRYLDKNEIETLKVLSVPRYWNNEIFKLLIDEYKTGYPVSAMNVLCRFSFIDSAEGSGTFVLHDLMRKGMMQLLDKEIKTSISKLLFERYSKDIIGISYKEITDESGISLNEAFYHGKNSLSPAELQKWFHMACGPFNDAAKWKMLSPLYEELISLIEAASGKENMEHALVVTYFSSVLYNLGEYKRALELIEDNFNDLKKAFTEDDNMFASLLNNLATIYYYRGEIHKSKEIYEQVIELRRKNLGENHRRYADVIDNLAVIYHDTGEFEKAIELHKQAAEIYRTALGENHVHYADALNNLASAYQKLGKYDESVKLYKKALNIVLNSVGEDHPRYGTAMNNIGRVYFLKGETASALQHNQKAYEIRAASLGENHPWTGFTLSNMGEVYYAMGELEKACELQQKAMEIFRNTVGEKHFHFANSLKYLAECLLALGKTDEALEYFRQSGNVYASIYGDENTETVEIKKRIEELNGG